MMPAPLKPHEQDFIQLESLLLGLRQLHAKAAATLRQFDGLATGLKSALASFAVIILKATPQAVVLAQR